MKNEFDKKLAKALQIHSMDKISSVAGVHTTTIYKYVNYDRDIRLSFADKIDKAIDQLNQ